MSRTHAYIGAVADEDGKYRGLCKCGKRTPAYVNRRTAVRNIVEHVRTKSPRRKVKR